MRKEKQFLLDEIKDKIEASKAFVLTKYERVNPNMAADFRVRLGKSGGDFEVVRKRILIKAAQAAGITIDPSLLEGHIGVVFALNDPVQVTKALYDYSKNNDDVLTVLAGRFEGKLFSAKDVEVLSKLPSKDEMRAQFLGLLEAPMAQVLSVMEALLTSLMHGIENKTQSNS